MTLVNDIEIIHNPATAMEVFDVSGAGDTVAATLLAGAAGKLELCDAVFMANRAAGIVVAKAGTYPVHRDELLKDLLTEERKQGKSYRTLSWEEIASLAKTWKACGEKIVFTNGCFDILHVGHVTYLEKAKNLGKHLIVGLNTDASVRRLKGETRPLVHELDRARVLAALNCVDAVVLFDQDTPTELIEKIRPDILVKGGDYKPGEVAGREYAGEVRIIEFEDGYSTTGVVEKIVTTENTRGKVVSDFLNGLFTNALSGDADTNNYQTYVIYSDLAGEAGSAKACLCTIQLSSKTAAAGEKRGFEFDILPVGKPVAVNITAEAVDTTTNEIQVTVTMPE
jgi:rfaE bifunctional protein nucleotidyltransferase chain/domain